jgi:hypothetical protein
MDGLLRGDTSSWASLVFDQMGEIHLSIDKLLDQRAKYGTLLKTLYAEMRSAGIKPGAASAEEETAEPEDMLAMLRRRKELRESQSG